MLPRAQNILAPALNRARLLSKRQKKRWVWEEREAQDFITQFSTGHKAIKNIIKKNWNIHLCDPVLKDSLPGSPKVLFRKAKCIKQIYCT